MDANKKPVVALNDEERFPLLMDLSYLKKLQQDQFAPKFNFQSGDRLNRQHLEKVKTYAKSFSSMSFWPQQSHPKWIREYIAWCVKTVPFYASRPNTFEDQPTIRRTDLHAQPWQFVSAECDLDDLLVYQTSGTTGTAMDVVFDPVSQACWIPQLESILRSSNIWLSKGKEHVAIALICDQQQTLTYASLSTYLEGAGILKINLNPADWRNAGDPMRFLERYNPEVLTGDPFALSALVSLAPKISPKAVVSSAMKLTKGVKEKFENYFQCPIYDVYSLTECRMVAVAEGERRHRAIRPELYLEIFDPKEDVLVKPGDRGELVITGGNNPFLPLVRYRTGDFCAMIMENDVPYLIDLEARVPVAYYRSDHSFVNNVDISRAMTDFPLVGFSIHQHQDKSITFNGWSTEDQIEESIKAKLLEIFGNDLLIEISISNERIASKPVSFTSDLHV